MLPAGTVGFYNPYNLLIYNKIAIQLKTGTVYALIENVPESKGIVSNNPMFRG